MLKEPRELKVEQVHKVHKEPKELREVMVQVEVLERVE